MSTPTPSRRVLGAMLRLAYRRTINRLNTRFNRKKKDAPVRPTRRGLSVWMVLFAGALLFQGVMAFTRLLARISAVHPFGGSPFATLDLDALGLAHRAQDVMAMLATAIFLMLLLRRIGDDEGASDAWSMEWLFALPARARAMFFGTVLGRALTDDMGWLAHLVLSIALLVTYGFGWWSLALAPPIAFAMNLQVAAVHLFVDVRLHRDLGHDRRRNVQAVCKALSTALYLFVIAALLAPDAAGWLARWVPAWPHPLPWAVVVEGITAPGLRPFLVPLTIAGALAVAAASVVLAEHAVARGLIVEAGPTRRSGGRSWLRSLRGVVGRELTMLARDRRLLVQTFVVPLFGIAYQLILMSPRMRSSIAAGGGAFAFGIGAWVLLQGAARITVGEGRAIWLLWTMPQKLGRPFLEKTLFWGSSGAIYAIAALAFAATRGTFAPLTFAIDAAAALYGVTVMAILVGAFSILYAEPGADQEPKPLDSKAQGLLFLIAALYGGTFFAEPWPRLVFAVIAGVTALAIWQRASDELPYLLDAHARPTGVLRASDGLLSLLVFMGLQAILAVALVAVHAPAWLLAPVAFVLAGAFASWGAVRRLRREGVIDLATALGWRAAPDAPPRTRAFPLALIAGVAAGGAAHLYGRVLAHVAPETQPSLSGLELYTFAALAVIAAPLVEELLFRGVLFGALRRSLPRIAAVAASATLFAVVHPPLATPPVFLLGVLAALARDRSGRLSSAMLVHAAYNATVLGLPLLLPS